MDEILWIWDAWPCTHHKSQPLILLLIYTKELIWLLYCIQSVSQTVENKWCTIQKRTKSLFIFLGNWCQTFPEIVNQFCLFNANPVVIKLPSEKQPGFISETIWCFIFGHVIKMHFLSPFIYVKKPHCAILVLKDKSLVLIPLQNETFVTGVQPLPSENV